MAASSLQIWFGVKNSLSFLTMAADLHLIRLLPNLIKTRSLDPLLIDHYFNKDLILIRCTLTINAFCSLARSFIVSLFSSLLSMEIAFLQKATSHHSNKNSISYTYSMYIYSMYQCFYMFKKCCTYPYICIL